MLNFTPFIRAFATTTALISASAMTGAEFTPAAPGNLQGQSQAGNVYLTWNWGNEGPVIFSSGFEDEEFPPEGWGTTDCALDPVGNWSRFEGDSEEVPFFHGSASAILQFAEEIVDDDPESIHQDEWLVAMPTPGATYLDFWYYIHPQLFEDGKWRDFPDHYYVMISRDCGETWTELWDARWDMGNVDAMQQASLFLGEPTDENTFVAFRGLSGETESLYYVWFIDDVEFRGIDETAKKAPQLTMSKPGNRPAFPAGMKTHRQFTSKSKVKAKTLRSTPEEEWLNAGQTTFRVYCDNEMTGDYIKTRYFTDTSLKEPGVHTFSVMAWNEAEDIEYEASTIDVDVDVATFNPVTNLKVSYEETGNGRYNVSALWDLPEGKRVPAYYRVYLNGKSIGWIDESEENERAITQSGLYKGIYTFEVEANYYGPDGAAERVSATVTPGTVASVENLVADIQGNNVSLSWKAPEASEVTYDVYRGSEKVGANISETSFVDAGVDDGMYRYNIHVVYPDGQISLPVYADVEIGDIMPVSLPVVADFNDGHLPAGWMIELIDPRQNVKEMYAWRFDNWFESEFPAELGHQEGFASVSGVAAAMNKLECHLITPLISFPADSQPEVSFISFYGEEKPGPLGSAVFEFRYCKENESEWTVIKDLAAVENGRQSYPLSVLAGSNAQLCWSFLSCNSGYALVDDIHISNAAGIDTPEMLPASGLADVYTIDGRKVLEQQPVESLSSLRGGIYVVKVGDVTYKLLCK